MKPVRHYKIGLLGCGTVGRGLVELVNRNRSLIRERSGIDLSFTKILVRDLERERPGVDRNLLTLDPEKVINNGCNMVVELIGGIEPAQAFIEGALARHKQVVTANKALMAKSGSHLLTKAAAAGVHLGFEASVCAGIPILHALQNGLVGNSIQSISGILNGTCNYILTRMAEGYEFESALQQAQEKGFAEADPSLDIDGYDAAQKLKILSELAFGGSISIDSVRVEGIRDVSAGDIAAARELGYTIKHIASAEARSDGVYLRVGPALLPLNHQLASVREENNAVLVRGDAVGEMLFQGKGAGSLPSASAVLADIVEIASQKRSAMLVSCRLIETSAADHQGQSYLRFTVRKPSVMGAIASTLEATGISLARRPSCSRNEREQSEISILTNACENGMLQFALGKISESGMLQGTAVVMPVTC